MPIQTKTILKKNNKKTQKTTKWSEGLNKNKLSFEIPHITNKFSFLYEKAANTDQWTNK